MLKKAIALWNYFKSTVTSSEPESAPVLDAIQHEEKEEAVVPDPRNKAASVIQRAVRAYRLRSSIGSSLNWQDLLFMNRRKIALRNQSVAKGLQERENGGHGDGYALGAFAFNPARDIFDEARLPCFPVSPLMQEQERAFRIKVLGLNPQQLRPPLDPEFCGLKSLAVSRFKSSAVMRQYPELRVGLTQKMNYFLFHLILQCYTNYVKHNLFHLITLCYANTPHNMSPGNTGYPTGKCGSQAFEKEQILASVQEGDYVQSEPQAAFVRAPFKAFRVAPTQLGLHAQEGFFAGTRALLRSELGVDDTGNMEQFSDKRKTRKLLEIESRETTKAVIKTIKSLRREEEKGAFSLQP